MAALGPETLEAARRLASLYPKPRSALVPICHLAQAEQGWLTPEAAEDIAGLLGITPAEVLGTASFYEMLRTEPVGRYLIGICTNIACMLRGAYELLEHAETTLGVRAGGTTPDGSFSLEETECVADCGRAPCLQVNYRFFGDVTFESFDRLVEDLRAGRLGQQVPPHGVLSRVGRKRGLEVPSEQVADERRRSDAARAERARQGAGGRAGGT
jgi:NADH-quinone oxidoreductase subunit E